MKQKHLLHALILAIFYICQFPFSECTGCGQRISLQYTSHGRIDTILQHYTIPCEFYIAAPTGQRIQLNFMKIFNTGHDTGTKVEVYEGNATQKSFAGIYSSGFSPYPSSYLSRSNQVILILKDVPGDSRQWNFQCEYLVTSGCKMKFRQMEGALTIPDYLDEINGEETCSFDITAEANKKISLIFSEIHLGNSPACSHQSLSIYEGQGATKVLSQVRCQQDTRQFLSNKNSLSIVLKTKKHLTRALKVYYVTGVEGCNRTYTESSAMISTPFFPHSLPKNLNCHYQIIAASGNQIFLKHKRNSGGASFTRVYEGMFNASKVSVSYPFPFYDYGRWQTPKYISESNILTITFITGSTAVSLNNQFYYSMTVGCNFNFSFDVGYVGSPRFPLNYPNNVRCNYTFEVQHGERFYAKTNTLELQSSINCQADKFSLHEGPNLRLSVCSSTNRYTITSVTNKMLLLFKTNEQTNARGFMVRHAITGSAGDRCYSYDVIHDWKKQNSQSKCDSNLVNGWYRFNNTAAGLLPNKCPSKYSCGQIWVLGKVPTVIGTTTSLQACARFQDDCCYDSWTINAKKCSVNGENFFIYYLRRPILCLSYCNDNDKDECMLRKNVCHANAICSTNTSRIIVCTCKNGYHGSGISCSDDNECNMGTHDCDRNAMCSNTEGSFGCTCKTGYHGNGRFCKASFPLLAQPPLVSLTTIRNSSTVAFKCRFDRNSNSTMARYNVSWFIKEQKIHIRSNIVAAMSQQEEVITLSELRKLRFQLGDIVDPVSPLTISEKDKTPLEITVISTIPILCIGAQTCSITLTIMPKQNGGHITLSHCQLQFKGSNSSQVKRFHISPQKKIMQYGDKIIQIDVAVHKIEGKIRPFWRDHPGIEQLQIIFKDAPFPRCSSTGDPHMTTFDNLYYRHYQAGEYVLVKNTCRQFEVHVRTFKCGLFSVSCNCGVAAREGNDVLIIDMCRDRVPKVSFPSKMKIVPNKSTRIRRDNSGRNFVMEFGSGARIEFYAGFTANIYVTIPSNDFQCTRGLCGTFDGKSDNDLLDYSGVNRRYDVVPSSFTESWKLPTGSSLFNHQPSKVICNTTNERQCICKYGRLNTTGQTDRSRVIRDCHETQNNNIHASRFTAYKEFRFPATKLCGEQQQPQNIENTIELTEDDVVQDYIYNPEQINVVVPTWPTRKGRTFNAVKDHCTNAIKNSQEGQTCNRLPSFNFNTFIDQCVEDIKISDDFQFLMTAKNAMVSACKDKLYTNASYWEKSGADGKSLQLQKELAGISCPGLCSEHGKCINGSCMCYFGFQSEDCSVDVLKGPEIKTIPNFSSCDQRKRKDCFTVRVYGSNFMNSKNLSCRISDIQILGNRDSGLGKEVIVNAFLISFAEIRCNLENWFKNKKKRRPYIGMNISVSNDGVRFSNSSLPYKVFDSQCMECINGSCHSKNSSCNVNGYCFAKCESDQSDSEWKCLPSKSTTSFSIDLSGLCGNASNASFPLLAQSPSVSLTTIRNSSTIAFKCRFDRNSSSSMARYNVSWFIKEQKLHVRSNIVAAMSQQEEVITLSELRNLRFQLGDILFCSVESFYSITSSTKSNAYMSKPFLVGFKVDRVSPLTISEKDKTPLEITVISTIPILCIGAQTCSITLTIMPKQNCGHITLSHCQLQFKGSNSSQVKRFQISPQKKIMQYGDKIIQIDVAVHKIEGKITPYWRDHRCIERLQIIFKDAPFATCSSTGDPHLTTFDNLYYHHYQVGEYVFLKNTCRQFEVHVRTFKCGPVSCNCGVAAREGNDVLIIDMCRDRVPKVSFPSKMKIVPNKSTRIRRDNSGRNFVMEFGSGARIEFNAYYYGASIYVTIPSNDFQCTRGMCGTFDGKSDNDLIDYSGVNRRYELPSNRVAPSSFTESWKLPTGSSLFNHQPSKVICNTTNEMDGQCICKYARLNTTDQNNRSSVIRDCHETQNNNIHASRFTAYKEFRFPATKHCGEQQQPQNIENTIELTEDDLVQDYIYNPGPINVVVPTWPTRKGRTLNAVKDHCTNAIKNSEEGQTCNRLLSFKFNTFIDQCVEDIKISDDFQFLVTAKNAMVSACKEELYTNASYWEKSGTDGKSLQLPKELAGISCPGLCCGHGKCINWSCMCYSGFQSEDCSVDVLKGPEIKTIPNFSSCDQRKRKDCFTVRVYGSNFMNSKNLSCRISDIQILGNRDSGAGKEVIVNALLISFAEIRCNLENWFKNKKKRHPYIGMNISVSNDGVRFSNSSLPYKVFDSKCMECINGSCHSKNSSCNVNGYCFGKCESDQSDSESKCLPSKSTTSFSTDLSGQCGNASNASKTIVRCSNHYMQIHLNKQYFNVSKYSSITLRDPTCKAKISNMYITLGSIPYLCGGERKQTVDEIIYENTVIMKAKPSTGMISKDADRKITFMCIYDRDGVVTSKPLLPITKADGIEGVDAATTRLQTVIIGSVVGVGILVFALALLFKKTSQLKKKAEKANQDIGIENNSFCNNIAEDGIKRALPEVSEHNV